MTAPESADPRLNIDLSDSQKLVPLCPTQRPLSYLRHACESEMLSEVFSVFGQRVLVEEFLKQAEMGNVMQSALTVFVRLISNNPQQPWACLGRYYRLDTLILDESERKCVTDEQFNTMFCIYVGMLYFDERLESHRIIHWIESVYVTALKH